MNLKEPLQRIMTMKIHNDSNGDATYQLNDKVSLQDILNSMLILVPMLFTMFRKIMRWHF